MMDALRRAAKAIAKTYDPDGISVWQNNGVTAHQSIPHCHFHVAGTIDDGGTEWGNVPELNIAETDRISDALLLHLPPPRPNDQNM